MKSDKFNPDGTQVHWACKAILDRRENSHATEVRKVRCWQLGAIIHRLKTDYGWPIHTRYRSPDNIAFCSLPVETARNALRFPPSPSALGKKEDVQ
jgi:hypothetical protein